VKYPSKRSKISSKLALSGISGMFHVLPCENDGFKYGLRQIFPHYQRLTKDFLAGEQYLSHRMRGFRVIMREISFHPYKTPVLLISS
jgi:hypothetical protein